MARNNDRDRDRGSKRVPKDARPRGKKKVCVFCKEHVTWVDYKDVNLLRRFMSDRGKIRSRRVTGNCAQHQRDVQVAIKTASERGPGRGPRSARAGAAETPAEQAGAEAEGFDEDEAEVEDELEEAEV